jgi:hypothetical protein
MMTGRLVRYNTAGDPPVELAGVYACRVDIPGATGRRADMFLVWSGGKWSYNRNDQFFGGQVFGWIGPLQRVLDDELDQTACPSLIGVRP